VRKDLIDRIDLHLSGPEWIIPKKMGVTPQRQVCGPGTKVTCPGCRDHIGDINSPVYSGIAIAAEQVDFRPHQRRKRGGRAVCAKCGGIYMRIPRLANRQRGVLEVHTELGWI
jgi:hypothetical protein